MHAPIVISWLILLVLSSSSSKGGELLRCRCTTSDCRLEKETSCTTSSLCYTQYLDRGDGSDPTVRGCIKGKTPLLCENRRPLAVAHVNWPQLKCCSTHMCNSGSDVINTTRRPSTSKTDAPRQLRPHIQRHQKPNQDKDELLNPKKAIDEVRDGIDHLLESAKQHRDSNTPSNENQMGISPIYISVLVIGILSLVIIGTIAIIVLRRHNRKFDTEYGAVDSNDYVKGSYFGSDRRTLSDDGHKTGGCDDSDVNHSSLCDSDRMYDNKMAVMSA